ncbi:dynamin-like protein 2 [Saccostrea echinata]|uniref:dynamin-like protein 2 n=1 Tax=Saccostrea echinata TaxID=191078 RepID=UPI002A7F0FF0|nr:dynamin-like protein 2 [Saccostrea echinata]
MEGITKQQKHEKNDAIEGTDIQEKVDVKEEKEMLRQPDDLHCSSDFRNTRGYDCLQEDIGDLYSSLQTLVDGPAFDRHIRTDLNNVNDINNQLELRKKDLMMTDCAIVVAGETSSGKSSIINLIIGTDIVPTDIMATTTRVCRIRYSDKKRVSALDKDGKDVVLSEFNDEEKLMEMMEDLARTGDQHIEFIDVWFPVPILKGNIIIVDTPGKGDTGQDDVANKMMEYLPNAVAFIFVVNVSTAGGFQDDRLLHIIKSVRQSMSQMYCFNPEDAIFLLNKWDAVPQKKNRKRDLYEELKEKVHDIWEDVKDSNILKFASAKVHEEEAYKAEFEKFQEILKEVITTNAFKRVTVHLRFIKAFLDDCETSLANKLRCARQSTEETLKELDQFSRDLLDIKNKRQEAYSGLKKNIDKFISETAEDLHTYIRSPEFRTIVLQGTEKYTRLTIGRELDSRIEKATLTWQEENVGRMFELKILQNLTDNFVKLYEYLHKIKSKMKGFTSPFDVEDKLGPVLVSLIAPSSTAVAGSMAMMYMSVSPKAAQAVAATGIVTGLVITGLVALDVLDNFETVKQNAYEARIDKITEEKVRKTLQKTYAERFTHVVQSYLEGDLKKEIEILSESVDSTKGKINFYRKEESSLLSLSSEISEIRNRLEEIEKLEIILV